MTPSKTKRRSRRISPAQRSQVLELLERGRSQVEAAHEAKMSEASVSRLVRQVKDQAVDQPRPFDSRIFKGRRRSGPPDVEYRDVDTRSKPPDPDAGESRLFRGFDIPVSQSGIARELGPENADAVGPVVETDDVLPPLSGAPDTDYKHGKRFPVIPEHPNQFPVRDPWPPRELSFAGQAALLRTSHRPESTHPPCYVDKQGGHHHRLMVLFQNS